MMKPPTVRKYLHLMGTRYRRTKYNLRHRQDPVQAAAARIWPGTLKKARAGQLDLFFLDETGFSPCLPPHPHLVPARTSA